MPISQAVALDAEHGSEVLPQWVEPDVLDGDDLFLDTGFLAPTDGLADVDPIGGLLRLRDPYDKGVRDERQGIRPLVDDL